MLKLKALIGVIIVWGFAYPDAKGMDVCKEIGCDFYSRIHTLGFAITQEPVDSRLNQGNRLGLSHYQTELDLRPDFSLAFRQIDLDLKPRIEFRWQKWTEGVKEGDVDKDAELFIYEWRARYKLSEKLFLSYGRENLQWGPSYLLSVSNPFNRNNGRNNPKIEVPSLDYGQLIWIPTYKWTISTIANTGKGRLEVSEQFKKKYAIKVDYTGENRYFSLIASKRESDNAQFGFYGGWSPTEALLLYIDGSVSNEDDIALLGGSSYTLETGPTITAEYFYQSKGCIENEIALCFPPFGDAKPEDILFRRNYLMLQYINDRAGDFDLTFRLISNLDDGSNALVSIVEYEWGKRTGLFAIGDLFKGEKRNEFGSVLDYFLMIGVEFTL